MTEKRIWKTEHLEYVDYYIYEEKIEKIIEKFQDIKSKYTSKDYKDITVTGSWDEGAIEFEINGKRLETDEEFKKRIHNNEIQHIKQAKNREYEKREQEKQEKALYAKLKAKYGD